MIKVDLSNGNVVWRTYMMPDNNNATGGFSGNSLWGSSPAIDVRRNQVYIATGDLPMLDTSHVSYLSLFGVGLGLGLASL